MNVVVICMRTGSTRLHAKSIADICGKTVLQHLVERYQSCSRVDSVLVATPTNEPELASLCKYLDVPHYQSGAGNRGDVVSLFDGALRTFAPDYEYVFRGLGDMPLFDVDLVDWRFDLLRKRNADVCWVGLQSDPLPVYGSRESPWSRSAWERIVKESKDEEREHVGLYLHKKITTFNVVYTERLMDEYYQPFRFELDEADDLCFFRALYAKLYDGPGTPRTLDVLRWLRLHHDVAAINQQVETKTLSDTRFNKRRGYAWSCAECGAEPLRTDIVRDGDLVTVCPNCGAPRTFKKVPPFLAGRR